VQYQTLTEALTARSRSPRAIHYLEGEHEERVVSLAELHERALGILYHLQALGAKPGDRLIIFLNNNEQFLDGFWAALLGGIVPVPLAVGISDEHRHKLLRIARRLGQPFLYSDHKSVDRLASFASTVGEDATVARLKPRTFLTDELEDVSRAGRPAAVKSDDIALIQFSSGSTSEPKGIVLTHGNILANCDSACGWGEFTEQDVSLSWMPLTHDMGLIGFQLFMMVRGIEIFQMPTELFIRRPLLWLQFATKHRATLTSSPNFGYRHLLKVLGDRPLAGLELSSIRLIINGAEPISRVLCDEFMDRMAPVGLKRTAMYPVYGLAEASLAVAMPKPGGTYRSITLDRQRLGVGAEATVSPAGRNGVELVGVGPPLPGTEVRIASEDRAPLADGIVGHILIKGANVTRGYFEAPEINERLITPDRWLDTGDLGVIRDGQLYITGRAKEVIFVNGQNYYPHDLEQIAQHAKGLELGKVAAAGCRPPGAESDELTLFVLHRGGLEEFVPIAAEVTHLVNEHAGLEVAHVVPVKRIPKTTSGKLQRVALEEAFVAGEFSSEMAELARLREAHHAHGAAAKSSVEARIKAICDAALPGKRVEVDDNLFEIGASSLTLIQIHEEIDREYPGIVDLTELFDYPTVAQLARHLESKLAPGSAAQAG
jgi:acyl-CoA synthetase (AMP-forming)/AMP-acid ligase II/acyl carrier protein